MDAEYRPYALLDRAQSARVTCVPVGEALAQLMARKVEAPPYEELINFPRAKDKDGQSRTPLKLLLYTIIIITLKFQLTACWLPF